MIESFVCRLKKIGIQVELIGNYPWIYLDKVNGKKVIEKFHANHGFTAFWYGIRKSDDIHPSDIGMIFKIIRKYAKEEQ